MTTTKTTTQKIDSSRGNLQEVLLGGRTIGYVFKAKTGGPVAGTPWQTFGVDAHPQTGEACVGRIFGTAFWSATDVARCLDRDLVAGSKADAVAQVVAAFQAAQAVAA